MYYWRKNNYEGLLEVASSLEDETELHLYAQYCRLRENGLRKQALSQLKEFIEIAELWNINQRYEFVDRLYWIKENNSEIYDLIPHPLHVAIVEPTIAEWIEENPTDPSGYRWLGGIEGWRKAISLDSAEQISRVRLIKIIIYNSHYATHHLPECFIGKPAEELMGLNEAIVLLDGLTNQEQKAEFREKIKDCRELISAYQDYQNSTYVGTFESWAELYDRRCC